MPKRFEQDKYCPFGLGLKNTAVDWRIPEEKQIFIRFPNIVIRSGPGIEYPQVGKITSAGIYEIVEEARGNGAEKWGLLKAFRDKRDGWVSLDWI